MYLTDCDILECVAILSIDRSTLLSFKSVKPVQKELQMLFCVTYFQCLFCVLKHSP